MRRTPFRTPLYTFVFSPLIPRYISFARCSVFLKYPSFLFFNSYLQSDLGSGGGSKEEDREKNRGLLVSLMSAFLINMVGSLMARKGVPDGYIVLNYGFVLTCSYQIPSKMSSNYTSWTPRIVSPITSLGFKGVSFTFPFNIGVNSIPLNSSTTGKPRTAVPMGLSSVTLAPSITLGAKEA